MAEETNNVDATEAVVADVTEQNDATEQNVDAVEATDETAAAVEGDAAEVEEEIDPYAAFKMELRLKPGKWYVIHTYAGFERKVRDNLTQRAQTMDVADEIYEIQVPMEDVVEIKNGQRKMVTRVRIPGYVLVRMNLNEDTWSVVRHTPGVTGFVGNAHNPTPLRFKEAFEMLKSLVEVSDAPAAEGAKPAEGGAAKQPVAEIDYEIGETITIKEGSFEGLTGTINEINPVSGKLTALVSLFGRETPVELAFDQVAKL
ncbi:transcription termination/antitermination protein NusG [Gulosibacter bifidus]|uniref:Transcription termination/antitermination protein NusG n=1 Tax=Gulosibacter bifidus TaxID=272239 RepID=A0ABW5RK49_9MICO|nr:transcription termination/antitermination protein NusG [Gulosibacter bifidus]